MGTMQNVKRSTRQPIARVRDFSVATKMLITGNGNSMASKIQKDLDAFLNDLQELDKAVWKVINQNKQRLYRFLDMVADHGEKKKTGPTSELKDAWSRITTSGKTLARDAKTSARALKTKAE